ncbi:hypothetical protein DL89DRAFT_264844 [Linderina pennispora]|uniref:Uncharacterized protein n=1 Tax=Linderina pennispora TaxID=61395 RepID=A0A1Y1WHB9_9FUNG|nr:uncharacterized protein DL89DRAFT_264844 [Linderina pennispora]ORX72626.1 hypothetical protein DL89DRAFT_264844 [Linderina pennispora]
MKFTIAISLLALLSSSVALPVDSHQDGSDSQRSGMSKKDVVPAPPLDPTAYHADVPVDVPPLPPTTYSALPPPPPLPVPIAPVDPVPVGPIEPVEPIAPIEPVAPVAPIVPGPSYVARSFDGLPGGPLVPHAPYVPFGPGVPFAGVSFIPGVGYVPVTPGSFLGGPIGLVDPFFPGFPGSGVPGGPVDPFTPGGPGSGLPGSPGGGLPGSPGGGLPGGPGGGFPGNPGGGFPGGPGGNGSNSGGGVCGLSPTQVSALTPLLKKLGLAPTVNEVKNVVDNIVFSLGDLLGSEGISQLLGAVNSLVKDLGLGGLDARPAVNEVISILRNQVPCLLNTLLPLP